jgi:hypothetical protein
MTKIQMTETLAQQHKRNSFMSLEHSNLEFVCGLRLKNTTDFDIRG